MTTGIDTTLPLSGCSEILPAYVPGARPVRSTVTVIGTGLPGRTFPDDGETESQFPPEAVFAEAVKFNVPPPVLETLMLAERPTAPRGNVKERFALSAL